MKERMAMKSSVNYMNKEDIKQNVPKELETR